MWLKISPQKIGMKLHKINFSNFRAKWKILARPWWWNFMWCRSTTRFLPWVKGTHQNVHQEHLWAIRGVREERRIHNRIHRIRRSHKMGILSFSNWRIDFINSCSEEIWKVKNYSTLSKKVLNSVHVTLHIALVNSNGDKLNFKLLILVKNERAYLQV